MSNLTPHQKKISNKATALQMQASNPDSSVWVAASAGTGKTHVLTQRILRLLIKDPNLQISEILAITFTKAAALEMQTRLIQELSKWVKDTDSHLLTKLEHLLENKPTLNDAKYARTLLARVIDDPIGLNISTVHSFCETLLRKFPLEAGIVSTFTLIEERQERELLKKAWFKALKKQYAENPQIISEVVTLLGEYSLAEAVNTILSQKKRFYKMLNNFKTLENFIDNLRLEFNIITLDEQLLRNSIVDFSSETQHNLKQILNAYSNDSTQKAAKNAEKLAKVLDGSGTVADYISIFFTQKMEPQKTVFTKKTSEYVAFDALEFAQTEVERIDNILDKITNVQNYKITKCLAMLSYDMFNLYAQEKTEQSLLDFNDLIDYAENLVNKSEIQDWIRYKLDSKIKHCLIDEAQDTDLQQWNILHGIIQEFYYGEGQHQNNRTTFVVGDMKQSIYRFRGANPEVFDTIRANLNEKSKNANHDFQVVGLHTSFRSTRAVLNFVDDVFSDPQRQQALDASSDILYHQVFRQDQAGRIELMPILTKDNLESLEVTDEFEMPISAQQKSDFLTLRQLNYKQVAEKIKQLFTAGTSPQDILILLKNRNGMQDLTDQLTKFDIPHTGSDQIYLASSIIIDDLLAFAKLLCFKEDDLSLIQILKSPAFNFSDDQIFIYFEEYKKTGQKSFLEYIQKIDLFSQSVQKIDKYQQLANKVRVFDLYTYIFNDLDLVEKMMARLGGAIQAEQQQVKDTIDEFLRQIENYKELSLLSFLHWFKKDNSKIKKNTAGIKGAVRIMTVHGSKGLEADVVFLPDCGEDTVKKSISKDRLLFNRVVNGVVAQDSSFIYKTRAVEKASKLEKEIQAEQEQLFFEDDMRLLYVALTRARSSVYISAIQTTKELSEKSWYWILQQTMQEKLSFNTDGYAELKDKTLVFITPKLVEPKHNDKQKEEELELVIPSWYTKKATKEQGLASQKSSYNMSSKDYIQEIMGNKKGYQYGNIVHKLLEELPRVKQKSEYIDNFLKNKEIENKSALKDSLLQILDKYRYIFEEKNSLAEVKIQAIDKSKLLGVVDRIAFIDDKVYVVDYKTGQQDKAYRAKYIEQLESYRKVLAKIYPSKHVVSAILWVNGAYLEEV